MESTLNVRPLTYVYEESDPEEPLTPAQSSGTNKSLAKISNASLCSCVLKRSSDWQKVELLVIQNPTIICGTGIDLPDPFYPVEDKNNNPSNGNNDGDKVDVNMDVG